jgi:hypothetical protein
MITKDLVEGHAIYKRYRDYWNFLLQSYEGGVDYTGSYIDSSGAGTTLVDYLFKVFANGKEVSQTPQGNLFMHPKERTQDYAERVRMSYYYNFCDPVIDIYINHLFKQPSKDEFGSIEKEVEAIGEDVDNKGSSIEEFRKEVAEQAQVYGHCYVVVDSPNFNGSEIITLRDQIESRAFPYCTIYSPQQVINWSLDKFGNPYWVLLLETDEANQDPYNYDRKSKGKPLYRLWTREEWKLYDSDLKEVAGGIHGLGIVPIVCVFNKRSKKVLNFLGVSSLADIAFISRDVYNSCSELKQILRDQTFAFLAVQGTSDEYNELSVGTSKGLLYPENRNVPQYVSPPSQNAEVYFSHIDRQIRKIYQLAKLEGGSAQQEQQATQQTGVSKAWDFNETNSALSKKSAALEDAEMKIWKIFALWQGKEFDGVIEYPKEFSVSKMIDDIDEAERVAKLSLGKTFNLEVLKTIQKKKFPGATGEDLDVMAEEAEALLNTQQVTNGGLRGRFPALFNNANSAA